MTVCSTLRPSFRGDLEGPPPRLVLGLIKDTQVTDPRGNQKKVLSPSSTVQAGMKSQVLFITV